VRGRVVGFAVRLLLSTRSAFGHLYPMMPLADAARAAGHEVVFSLGPEFVPKLQALGYRAEPTGIEIREAGAEAIAAGTPVMGADGRTNLDFGAHVFVEVMARRVALDVAALLADVQPDVVVAGQFDQGAGIAAAAAGIPVACHAISPHWPIEAGWSTYAARLSALAAEHGLAVPANGFVGDVYLSIFPDVLEVPSFVRHATRRPMRPVAWSEPGTAVPPWVRRRQRPLVYLTLGTMVVTDDALRSAMSGLASLDVDVLIALGSAAGTEIGDFPPNVHIERFVDQVGVIETVDLVVHHGGSGTVLAALATGVPQVVLPRGADQFVNAERLDAAGLAAVLPPGDATPDAVAEAARAALAEPAAAEAEAVRTELSAMPNPAARRALRSTRRPLVAPGSAHHLAGDGLPVCRPIVAAIERALGLADA
jgi:UDP:flavonoid glycosyltransferase YjiC (YdhE family)